MKKSLFCLLLFYAACLTGGGLEAADKKKMIQDLDNIKNTFEVKYAPFEWKKNFSGWDLEDQINLAKLEIQTSGDLTAKDYHRILHSFFRSTKDWHVQDFYYSLEYSFIPIDIEAVGDKFYVTDIWFGTEFLFYLQQHGLYISEDLLTPGDEIIAINGKPAKEAVDEILKREFSSDTSLTARAMAVERLTLAMAQMGECVPQGWLSLAFRHSGQDEIKHASIQWVYSPDTITNKSLAGFGCASSQEKQGFFRRKMYSPAYHARKKARRESMTKVVKERYAEFFQGCDDDYLEEDDDGRSLQLGTPIWSRDSYFKPYIYLSPVTNQRIGYIRIPTFAIDGGDPNVDDNELHNDNIRELEDILAYFQNHTDALVIDQVDNGGGYLFYMYAILSMLSENPLAVPPERITITQKDVFNAVASLDDDIPEDDGYVFGYYADDEFFNCYLSYCDFIVSQWNAGKTLTDPCYILGLEFIKPHPKVRYTKPILVLIDKMDFSCADFFPAILQDNKRALLFGENTAGAGGAVEMHDYPNILGVMGFSYTASIAERSSGQPIENLGVAPDIPYQATIGDILDGYRGYAEAVNNAIEGLLRK